MGTPSPSKEGKIKPTRKTCQSCKAFCTFQEFYEDPHEDSGNVDEGMCLQGKIPLVRNG
jgi:hypothetical protein